MSEQTPQTEPKAKEKPLPPELVAAKAKAKELNLPISRTRKKLFDALEKAGWYWNEDAEAWQEREPTPEPEPTPDRSNDIILSNDHNGIWIRGKDADYSICNFGIRVTHLITDSRNNAKWGIDILHGDRQVTHLTLEHDDFASHGNIHKALLKYGFVFRGGQREFNYLKEALLPQVKKAERIERLGYHADSGTYVFTNGVFNHKFTPPDAFGIIEVNGKAYHLGYDVKSKQHENVARFVFLENRVKFDQIAKVMHEAYGLAAVMPLCYSMASLFRDVAYDANHFFPLLCLYGSRPNTGKSTIARILTAFSGYMQGVMSIISKNTEKSYPRTLDQMVNAILWFDELPESIEDKEVGKMLQAAYDGSGYTRSESVNGNWQGNETSSIHIKSGVVLTGNHLPRDEVLLTRWCVVTMNNQIHTDAQQAAFRKILKLLNGGLSSLTGEILRSSEIIREAWFHVYSDTLTRLQKIQKDRKVEVNERLLNNTAVILTPAIILEKAGKIRLRQAFGITDDLETFGFEAALAQQPLLKGKSALTTFFEIMETGRERGEIIAGRDYIITQRGERQLQLRMLKIMSYYQKEFLARFRPKSPAHRDEIESLLETHPAFVEFKPVKFYEHTGKDRHECTIKKTPCLKFALIADEFGALW